jgi:hypothetical protein
MKKRKKTMTIKKFENIKENNSPGFYNQNQEMIDNNKVFDLRKNYERTYNYQTNDKIDHGDFVTTVVGTTNQEKDKLLKIAKWIYEVFEDTAKVSSDFDDMCFYNVFDFAYSYLLNNYNEIYTVFGKSLNDEEKKTVCVLVLCLFYENYLKNEIFQMMREKIEKNKKGNVLLETCLKTGITPGEAIKIFFEVSPPSKRIERMIKKNKEYFKKKYGKDWERILYATAWKQYNRMKNKD